MIRLLRSHLPHFWCVSKLSGSGAGGQLVLPLSMMLYDARRFEHGFDAADLRENVFNFRRV